MSRLGWTTTKIAAALIGLARLGLPALGTALLAVVIIVAVLCWIVASKDRSDHAAQLIGAARGRIPPRTASQEATSAPQKPQTAVPTRWRRKARKQGTGNG
jgi:hypothetical protein